MREDGFIQALLASPLVLALFHWWTRRPRNIREGLGQTAAIYEVLARFLSHDHIKAVWIEVLENGGGIPTATNMAYSTATCFVARDRYRGWTRELVRGEALVAALSHALQSGKSAARGVEVADRFLGSSMNQPNLSTHWITLETQRSRAILLGWIQEDGAAPLDPEELVGLRGILRIGENK